MRKLDAGVHVVSGTPGRVKDMMERQKLRTRHIKVTVCVWGGGVWRGGLPVSDGFLGSAVVYKTVVCMVWFGTAQHGTHVAARQPVVSLWWLSPAAVLSCPSGSKLLVLDEADEMLSMNFTEQIYNCYRYLPPDCQVSSN